MPKTMTVASALIIAVFVFTSPYAGAQTPAKPAAKSPATRPPTKQAGQQSAITSAVRAKADAILAGLDAPKPDVEKARNDSATLMYWLAMYADPESEAPAFRAAAITDRVVLHLGHVAPDKAPAVAKLLSACPTFAARLCFLTAYGKDSPADRVYALALRLEEEVGAEALETYAELAAAICAVHYRPLERRINENTTKAPDAVAIFKYFVSNEEAMVFGLKNVPAALLTHVVDVTAPLEQLSWARSQFAREQNLARLYAMVPYDFDHLVAGTKKKVTENGFSLQNIRRFGGVCADQAYFTAEVAKSLGVPSAYVVGRDATVGHAWVGLFEAKGKNVDWNFDTGRYPQYQQVRGNVEDPVTGGWVSDGVLDVVADSFALPPSKREESLGLMHAAERWITVVRKPGTPLRVPADWLPEAAASAKPAREVTAKATLELIRVAAERCPSTLQAWRAVANMSQNGELSLEDKREWAEALERLCGRKYPDFTWQVLVPMISGIEDPQQQDKLWDRVIQLFKSRPDLASGVRIAQAQAWEKRNNPAKAWDAYQDVVNHYADESPMVLVALGASEKLLESRNKTGEVLPMYERAWKKTRQPEASFSFEFRRQSNWFRVGSAYARALSSAGRDAEAQQVKTQLGVR